MIQKIGRYEIIEVLGRGAMGIVYKAHDPAIDRVIAIKVIKLEAKSLGIGKEEIKSRFLREARSAGTLSHPSIITIYDVGEKRDSAYIAMEYIDGKTFADIIAEGVKLNYEQICNTFSQIASALDYAHKKGIIHRDLKPANIMLTKEGIVKLCDFGIAKIKAAGHTTRTGIIVGTPYYMSPEQVKGEKTIDGRSDIFSLAIVLYELITGDIPFKGETTSILYKIVHEDPPPPELITKDMAKFYETIILKAMAKNPENRYQSCTEFAKALKIYQSKYLRKKKDKGETATAQLETVIFAGAEGYSPLDAEATVVGDTYKPLTGEAGAAYKRPRLRRSLILAFLIFIIIGGASYFGLLNWKRLKSIFYPSQVQPGENSKTQAISNLFQGKVINKTLYISSKPSGASVFTNGKDTGVVTPANISLSGKKGDVFNLLLKKEFYHDISQQIVLNKDMAEKLNLTFSPRFNEVLVETKPPGAIIEIDEEEFPDKTPAKIKLTYGKAHKITLKIKGYYNKIVELNAEELSDKIIFQLDVIPEPGFLRLKGNYPVDVYLGGRLLARSAVNKSIKIQAGSHNLNIINKEFFLNLNIKTKIISKQTADFTLPSLGKINIQAMPSNCKIYINGIFLDYPPIFNRKIVAGKHNVKCIWADGKEQKKQIEVAAAKSAYANFNVQEASK